MDQFDPNIGLIAAAFRRVESLKRDWETLRVTNLEQAEELFSARAKVIEQKDLIRQLRRSMERTGVDLELAIGERDQMRLANGTLRELLDRQVGYAEGLVRVQDDKDATIRRLTREVEGMRREKATARLHENMGVMSRRE